MNFKKIAGFAIGPLGAALLGFISLPITAWFFNAEDIGRLALLGVASGFCMMFFSLGLDQAYVREFHETFNKEKLWKQTTLPGLYFLIFLCFLLFLDPYLLSKLLLDTDSILLSILIMVIFLTNHLIRFFSLILRMQEKGFLFSMSQIWPKLFNIIFLIIFVMLLKHDHDFIYLIYAQVLANIVACIMFGWNTKKEWFSTNYLILKISEIIPLLKFGIPLILGGLAYWGLNSVDRLFLKWFANYEELGIYSIATSISAIAGLVQSIFSVIWAPTVYKWVKNNENLEKVFEVSWYLTVILVFVFAVLGLFNNAIAIILPKQYETVQYVILPAIAAPLLYTLSETTGIGIGISRKSYLSLCAALGAFFINVILNFILIPRLGALGASIASSLSFIVFFTLKTEFSVQVWKSFARIKIYTTVFFTVGMSILNSVYGREFNWIFKVFWFILLIISSIKLYKMILSIRLNSLSKI